MREKYDQKQAEVDKLMEKVDEYENAVKSLESEIKS